MAVQMRTPWKVAMSQVGPSITYAGDYQFNCTLNVADGTTDYRASGPGQMFGSVIHDDDFAKLYTEIALMMESHSFLHLQVSMSGVINAEWEAVEGISQAMSLVLNGSKYSVMWRANNIDYDDAEAAMGATAVIVRSLDPAMAAHGIELVAMEITNKLEQMFAIAYENGSD